MPPFDQGMPEQAVPTSPSLDRENKLLSFSMPVYNYTLLDYSLRRTSMNLSAQLHGMFFLAEPQWPTNPDAPPPPPELTCYRRNLFQISGSVTLPRSLRYIMTEQGNRIPILAQELTVSATESVEGNPVKIISVPWKTPVGGPPTTIEDKVEKEPPSIPLDTMAGSDMDADYATFPIQWKRLQFRIATANNGRRKELQQHFVIRLKILATLSTGAKIPIVVAESGAIIVRGRSPRNFQSRKDLPLSTSAGASRKTLGAGLSRTSTGDSALQASPSKPAISPEEVAQVMYQQLEDNDLQRTTSEINDWNQMTEQSIPEPLPDTSEPNDWSQMTDQPQPVPEPLPTPDYSHSMMPPQIPPYIKPSSPEGSSMMPLTRPNLSALNAPVSLSFSSDDEGSPILRSSRPSLPRPPTSNPSLPQASMTKSQTVNHSSPPPPPLQKPPKQRPRFNSRPASSSTSPTEHQNTSNSVTATTTTRKPRTSSSSTGLPPYTALSSSPGRNVGPARTIAQLSTEPDSASADPADTLYEYFPLGLDDWLPPVDAVYRPHGVHRHAGPIRRGGMAGGVGADAGAGSALWGTTRTKRYLSADE